MEGRRLMKPLQRERLTAALFIAPAGGLIVLFVLLPAIAMVRTSLHAQSLTAPEAGPFSGWDNYRAILMDPDFRSAASNTAYFALLVVPLQTVLALLLALWVNGPRWSRRTLRLAIFIPTTLSLTVTAVLWKLLYEPAGATGSGLLNGLLTSLGLPAQPFLTSPRQAMLCLVGMSIWQGAGFQMMIFLAGLQTIPAEQYEAAELDGATQARRFLHITLPAIAPTAAVVVTVTSIFALKLFVQPHLMTRGGPLGATQSLVQYMYRAAFTRRDLGIACAAGVVFLSAVGIFTLLQRLAARRWEEAA
jgi:ABC-type sugar transport system permease subunit